METLWIILLSMSPVFELRAGIPYGIISTDLHWSLVFMIAVFSNILVAFILWFALRKFVHFFCQSKKFEKFYHKTVKKAQKKIHPYIHKYGIAGLALFIGMPIPGSGVYTGTLGAFVLGYHFKRFITAAIIGVIIAGLIVTAIMVTGTTVFDHFIIK